MNTARATLPSAAAFFRASPAAGYLIPLLGLIAGMYAAEALHTDYGYVGVIAISLFYWLRKSRMLSAAAGM